jgi:hypothetical protein
VKTAPGGIAVAGRFCTLVDGLRRWLAGLISRVRARALLADGIRAALA